MDEQTYLKLVSEFCSSRGISQPELNPEFGLHITVGPITVSIVGHPTLDHLVLFSQVGQIAEDEEQEKALKQMQKLLTANVFGQDTMGSSLGWMKESGDVVLSLSLPVRLMDAEVLGECFDNFSKTAMAWQEKLDPQRGEEASENRDESVSSDLNLDLKNQV